MILRYAMAAVSLAVCVASVSAAPAPRRTDWRTEMLVRMTFGEQVMHEVDKAAHTFKISKTAALSVFIICVIAVLVVYCYCFCHCCGRAKVAVYK